MEVGWFNTRSHRWVVVLEDRSDGVVPVSEVAGLDITDEEAGRKVQRDLVIS